jgi:hypothetical protein
VEKRVVVIVMVEDPDVLVIVVTVSAPVTVGAAVALMLPLVFALATPAWVEIAETVPFPALAMREEKRGARAEREDGKAVSLEPDADGEYIGTPPAVMADTAAGRLIVADIVAGEAVGAGETP